MDGLAQEADPPVRPRRTCAPPGCSLPKPPTLSNALVGRWNAEAVGGAIRTAELVVVVGINDRPRGTEQIVEQCGIVGGKVAIAQDTRRITARIDGMWRTASAGPPTVPAAPIERYPRVAEGSAGSRHPPQIADNRNLFSHDDRVRRAVGNILDAHGTVAKECPVVGRVDRFLEIMVHTGIVAQGPAATVRGTAQDGQVQESNRLIGSGSVHPPDRSTKR